MLVVDCKPCRTRFLVSTSRIVRMFNTDRGIVTVVRCPHHHLTAIHHGMA